MPLIILLAIMLLTGNPGGSAQWCSCIEESDFTDTEVELCDERFDPKQSLMYDNCEGEAP